MPRSFQHTKITFTLGPATESEEMLEKMIVAGVDLCRLNMAHAKHEWIRQVVRRAIIAETNARQQIQATMLGPVHFLTASEIAYAERMQPKDPDRAWRLWKQRAGIRDQ